MRFRYSTTTKAINQLVRRDPEGVERYRAELRYFHVPQRFILGITPFTCAVQDEAFTIPDDELRKLFTLEETAVEHVAEDIRAARAPPLPSPR
ncbi:hypothetical protein ACFVAM_01850 [Streptomyces californicus]|uniref:hypothetical protein n=1 Tax=Streptomyces californicus TaxID=67351 RepID=UPI003681AA82